MTESYVYLLRSLKSGRYYLGWTTDLVRRLEEHNTGLSYYTRFRGPWEMVGYEWCATPKTAEAREKMLKRNPRMLSLFKKRIVARSQVVLQSADGGLSQVVG